MRICKIWDADYPWDIRVEKIVNSLTVAGHTVHLVCRNQSRRSTYESDGRFCIHRLPLLPHMPPSAHKLWNFPFPFNPVWMSTIARVLRKYHPELILVRDLPLALSAAVLGKVHHIPVILDMAENYPAMLQDTLDYVHTGPISRLIRNPALARYVERLSIRLVDHIFVVVEESRERLIQAGVPADRLSIVSNTPTLDRWQTGNRLSAPPEADGYVNLVYLGNLEGARGIDVAIRALRALRDSGHAVRLSVIGDGPCLRKFRAVASELGVSDVVTFAGRLSLHVQETFARLHLIMAQSHIGLIPHYVTESINTTISNKLFDYMQLGLPVIVSNSIPTARIVREVGCGEVFRDRDEVDLARCVMALTDPQVRECKGKRGQAAVRRRYNWDYDSRVLVHTLEAVKAQRI